MYRPLSLILTCATLVVLSACSKDDTTTPPAGTGATGLIDKAKEAGKDALNKAGLDPAKLKEAMAPLAKVMDEAKTKLKTLQATKPPENLKGEFDKAMGDWNTQLKTLTDKMGGLQSLDMDKLKGMMGELQPQLEKYNTMLGDAMKKYGGQ